MCNIIPTCWTYSIWLPTVWQLSTTEWAEHLQQLQHVTKSTIREPYTVPVGVHAMQGVQAPQNTIEHHRSQSTAKKPYGRQDRQKYSRVVLEWCLECTKDCRLDENMKNSALQLHINLQQVVYTWVLKQTRLLSFRGRQMEYLIRKIFVFTVCRHVWYGSNVVHWERMSNTILSWGIYFLFIATRTFHSLLHNLARCYLQQRLSWTALSYFSDDATSS